MEIFWKRIPAPLEEIKDCGFDGVECHLIGQLRSARRVLEILKEAETLGLELHFHQGWSWKTGQPNLYNMILRAMGALVPIGSSLEEQVKSIRQPVVIYGNRVNEPSRENYRYQTASECTDSEYAMSFGEFTQNVMNRNLPVVFDTQHVLEWFYDVQGVEGLPTSRSAINKRIRYLWEIFRPFVAEIHLCDFDPRLGRTLGRNVVLGEGIFPVDVFCGKVYASEWDGVIIPEIRAEYLAGARKLKLLNEAVRRLFHQY